MVQSKISDENLLAEIEDLIRTMPTSEAMRGSGDQATEWRGRLRAVSGFLSPVAGPGIRVALDFLRSITGDPTKVREMILAARHELRMRTVGPLSLAVDAGAVFHYFDAVTKVMAEANSDILFVDPYLDKEFVGRYLPHVAPSAKVRLLMSKNVTALVPAVELFSKQSGLAIEVRTSADLHDRYVFIDRRSCYQSGASFKDGGQKSTTLTQIVDAFPAVLTTYEKLWHEGNVRFPTP